MQLAVRAIARGRLPAFRGWLVATLVLAAAFVANQAHEWSSLEFHVDTHTYGSAFYVMTGFHGIHVIGGMLAMVLLLGRAGSRRFGAGDAAGGGDGLLLLALRRRGLDRAVGHALPAQMRRVVSSWP